MWTFLRKKMKKKTGTFMEASASEYLAITGAGIDGDLKLAKTWLLCSGQHCNRFSISPRNYAFDVRAMSNDNVTFRLPTVLTIGPNVSASTGDFCDGAADDPLHLYARLIAPPRIGESPESLVRHIVESIVRADIREHAAELAMEEIFEGAQESKNWVKQVFEQVQLDLDPGGIFVYNANVKPPVQEPVHEHLSRLVQKTTHDELYQRRVKAVLAMKKVVSRKSGRPTDTRAVIVGDDSPITMPPWDIGDHLGTVPDSTVWTDKHIIVWN